MELAWCVKVVDQDNAPDRVGDLKPLLAPRVVAVIGASRERRKVGSEILHNILASGFTGQVVAIHPSAVDLHGVRAYPSIGAVPVDVDLAVIVVPAADVEGVVDACLTKGVRALCIISAGFGDLNTDRFNVFGVLDVQQLDRLRSGQRSFIKERELATTLPAQMSSNTFPANIDISGAQRAALIAAGLLPAGSTSSRVNPSSPGCNPPATVYAPKGPGGVAGCSYDYMEDTEIYPDSRKVGFIGRATFQLDAENQLFAELVQSEAKTKYVLSPNPVQIGRAHV